MLIYIYITILIYALYRSLRSYIRIYSSFRYYINSQKYLTDSNTKTSTVKKFFVLIPVLREQECIREAFAFFESLEGNCEIIFIPTKKEEYERADRISQTRKNIGKLISLNTLEAFIEKTSGVFPISQAKETYELLCLCKNITDRVNVLENSLNNITLTRDILSELINNTTDKRIKMIEYPFEEGFMAHQLNYVCNIIEQNNTPENTYIIVYNIDSKVGKDTIVNLRNFINQTEAVVIQQSALFIKNIDSFTGFFRKYMLRGIALLQSRWTLAHEVPRILKQRFSKIGTLHEPAHLVGHGLIIRLDVLSNVGYFPTIFINEDLPLGYLVRLHGYKIDIFPKLELADAPITINSMFKQYRTWFYGAGSYPQYMKYALSLNKFSRVKIIMWGAKYFIRSILWLFLSITWIFLLIIPLLTGRYIFFWLGLTTFIIYAPLNFLFIQYLYNKNRSKLVEKSAAKLNISPIDLIATLPVYLTHSLGPLLATKDLFNRVLFNKGIYKNKTER